MAARYLVPAGHPSPQRVKDRLDAVIARELPRTLARAFDSWFSESDQSIWIIRQLNIETAINVTGDPEHITRALTAQIARNLGATFQDENQDNVRYFPNRAEYLASFLSNLAFGTAWGRWYYQSFAGLNALPLSAALRTAICDDIATGKEALGLLAMTALQKVVHSLTLQDARQVLEQLASSEGRAGDDFHSYEAVFGAGAKNDAALAKLGNEWQRALYLFIAATHAAETSGGSSLKDAARAIATDKDGLSKAAAGPDSQVLAHPRSTVFGGIFLILPHVDELPLAEATRDWPHAGEAAAISLVRFLVLLKCCGRENSERAFNDPLLRDLLLIPRNLSPGVFRTWQSQLKPEHLEHFLSVLFEWQCSRGAIGGKEQLLAVSKLHGRPLLVLIDADQGLWSLVDQYSPHRPQKIIAALRLPVAMLLREQGVLYCDPSLISSLQANFAGLNIIDAASNHTMDPAQAEKRSVDAIVVRLDKLPDELEFLTLPVSLKIARPLDLALSIAAQHLLRGIAWRLPGFARSNLPYLSRNFLEFTASVEEEPARRVVRAGGPPLHLVLKMTGMMRQSYRLSWLDERPFALFQGD
ncbi:MAG: hypothetical protein ACREQW_24270 [Candidatus Binatia bacterium]